MLLPAPFSNIFVLFTEYFGENIYVFIYVFCFVKIKTVRD